MVVRIRKFVIPLVLAVLAVIGCFAVHAGVQHFYRQNYPVHYRDTILKYTAEYEVDPLFILAVMKTESDFNPNAVSEADARGLMQIAETTFDWIKDKLNDETSVFSDMSSISLFSAKVKHLFVFFAVCCKIPCGRGRAFIVFRRGEKNGSRKFGSRACRAFFGQLSRLTVSPLTV